MWIKGRVQLSRIRPRLDPPRLHTLFRDLGLFFVLIPRVLSFEDSHNHYLRGLGHKHRRSIDVNVSIETDSERPTWSLTDSYQGKEFYDGFTFEAMADPTHGRVK
jgi:hypothetical protein